MTKVTTDMLYLSSKILKTVKFRTEKWKETNDKTPEKPFKYDAKWSVTKIRICFDILHDEEM